jgi:hypothetical protein
LNMHGYKWQHFFDFFWKLPTDIMQHCTKICIYEH